MGMFSYICSKSGNAISENQPLVTLYFIVDGVVQEVMSGPYNGYGAVNLAEKLVHKALRDGVLTDVTTPDATYAGEEWVNDWSKMVDIHYDSNPASGQHAIIGAYDPSYIPTEISEDDPNQGWGECGEDEDEYEYCDFCGEEDGFCEC